MASALPNPVDCCECDDCSNQVVVNIVSGTTGWFESATAAAGRLWPSLATNKILVLNGLIASGDGQGGMYYWNNTSTAVDDGVTVLTPSDNPAAGRWLKLI